MRGGPVRRGPVERPILFDRRARRNLACLHSLTGVASARRVNCQPATFRRPPRSPRPPSAPAVKTFRIICSSLLVIGGLAAFYFSVRALGTQSSWTAAANAAEQAATQSAEGLPALETRELALRGRMREANAGFGDILYERNPTFDPQGNVALNLGTQDGLSDGSVAGGDPASIVHLFAPTGGGEATVYVGSFQVDQATERQSQLSPTFVVQTGEPQSWPVGQGEWRVRVEVPPSRASSFIDRDASLVKIRERLRNRSNELDKQREGIQDARDTLAAEEQKLLGDPAAPAIEDAPEIQAGLIATLTDEDLDRAEALVELDRLRRAVKNASDRLQAALKENVELAGQLPTAAPPRTAQGE